MSSGQTSVERTILLVDDDPIQLKLSQAYLRDAGFKVDVATDAASALAATTKARPDLVLSDVLLGDVDGFSLCQSLRSEARFADIPIVLTSSHFRGEDDRALAISMGASALVQRTPEFREELAAVRAAFAAAAPPSEAATTVDSVGLYARRVTIQLNRFLGQARSADARYQALLDNANITVTVLDLDGFILEANRRWTKVLQIPPEQMVGHHLREFSAPGHEDENFERYKRDVTANDGEHLTVPIRRADGAIIYMEFTNTRINVGGETLVLAIGREVTEAIEAAKRLEASEAKYRSLLENIPDAVQTSTLDGRITFVSHKIERLTGFPVAELVDGGIISWLQRVHPDDKSRVRAIYETVTTKAKTSFDMEYRWQRKDGSWAWFHDRAVVSKPDGVERVDGVISDISERKNLEAQMRQAQRLEAIGQLTGGVAHDFNNILSVILLNSQFLIESLGESAPESADVAEIKIAAERAAALTRQLLAFSRTQLLQPKTIDLNDVTGGVVRMLRRLIGENIELALVPGANLNSVVADPTQIEQVLMNLVVNARDAMPSGGRLTITTANVELDGSYALAHTPVVPGRYVMFSVSDTGCGMDEETQRRAFDPFFTTKEVGKGTGLGLSTCYGIVKQSGGYIWVYSESGHGTTFKVYLPEASDEETSHVSQVMTKSEPGGDETILVIEDEEKVRNAVQRILSARGYRVLLARDGIDAFRVAQSSPNPIGLILSDVIMPNGSGPEVVQRITDATSHTCSLFMSGYTDSEVLANGLLQPGTNFIQKPFTAETLTHKVREVLDA